MRGAGVVLVLIPFAFALYAYAVYPILLRLICAVRRRTAPAPLAEWPRTTIIVPCFNEETVIGDTLDRLLAADYPHDRLDIIVVSDGSTDRTDAIVQAYAARDVRLVRLRDRRGKTAAENAGREAARGDIIVNVDASAHIHPQSLKRLIQPFADPTVGIASGHLVGAGAWEEGSAGGDSVYLGYEMAVRALETRVDSIVGASGCFFATRRGVDEPDYPLYLSRDFASALIAHRKGYRSVSVQGAMVLVPKTAGLRGEMHRKLRTMARGLATLWHERALLNPFAHGVFSFMLFSHKLSRWLVYLTLPLAAVGMVLLSVVEPGVRIVAGVGVLTIAVGALGMRWPESRRAPAFVTYLAYGVASTTAGVLAWMSFLSGKRMATWSPTRRSA